MGKSLNIITLALIVFWATQEFVRYFSGAGSFATLALAIGLVVMALVWAGITYLYWNEKDDF